MNAHSYFIGASIAFATVYAVPPPSPDAALVPALGCFAIAVLVTVTRLLRGT